MSDKLLPALKRERDREMARIGSFGNRKKPEQTDDTIEYCGEELSLRPLDGYTLLEFTELITRAQRLTDGQALGQTDHDPTNPEADSVGMLMLVSVRDMIQKTLSPEDHDRFVELTKEFRVDFPALMGVATAIFAWASGRPSRPQLAPSELRSTDGTNVNDSFSKLAAQLNESDSGENRAIRRVTGRKGQKAVGS